jgi:hypothetical protein
MFSQGKRSSYNSQRTRATHKMAVGHHALLASSDLHIFTGRQAIEGHSWFWNVNYLFAQYFLLDASSKPYSQRERKLDLLEAIAGDGSASESCSGNSQFILNI